MKKDKLKNQDKIAERIPPEFKKILKLVNNFPCKGPIYIDSSPKSNWKIYKDSKQAKRSLIDQKTWHSL